MLCQVCFYYVMWELGKDPLQLLGVIFSWPLMAKGFGNLGFGRDLLQCGYIQRMGFSSLLISPGERLIPHSN